MSTMASVRPLDHFRRGDPVARAFGTLTGRTQGSAHVWLQKSYPEQVALALQAHREAEAWARRESWAAPFRAELELLPQRRLDRDLLLEHLAADQLDDHWRVVHLNHQTTDTQRHWRTALARFHALNLQLMRALKEGGN